MTKSTGLARYSGRVVVRCLFGDASNQYECRIAKGGRTVGRIHVGLPASWASLPEYRHGVDSAEAIDSAARAAISFAIEEGKIDDSDVDWGNVGPVVTRRKAHGRY